MEDQEPDVIVVRGRAMKRVRVGEERARVESPCPGCGAYYFQLHTSGCEMEECPACTGSLASCECRSVD
jgi:hypothetical protein